MPHATTVPLPVPDRPQRRRHRGGVVVALLLLLALVAGAGVLADAIVRSRVQTAVEQQVIDQYAGDGVEVRLHGWPFLWQVRQDRLEAADLRADSLTVDAEGQRVEVRNVELHGTDLTGVRDQQQIVAGTVTGGVDVSWPTVRALSGVDLAYAGPDRVRLSTSFSLFGQQVPVTIEGTPQLDPATGGLGIGDATADVAGTTVPQRLVDPLLARAGDGYRLPPLGALAYDSLTVGPEAVRIGLVGTDVDTQQVLG